MKWLYYLIIVFAYLGAVFCAVFSLVAVPGYLVLKLASCLNAVLAFPYFRQCWIALRPGNEKKVAKK